MADFAPSIGSPRRFYLLKAHAALALNDIALMLTWCAKQAEQPGTVLPEDFPSRTALGDASYDTAEDLVGANIAELQTNASLTATEAAEVFAALAAL